MISMKPRRQKLAARLMGTPAVVLMTASVGLLITDYIAACRQAPVDQARLEALEKLAKEDATQRPALEAEWDRQAQATLDRAARNAAATKVLIVAAVVFLVCAKWSIALGDRRLPELSTITARRAVGSDGSRKRRRGPKADPVARLPNRVREQAAVDLGFVDETIDRLGRGPGAVIPILQAIQAHERYLPDEALKRVCDRTDITPAQIAGVSSFYTKFRRTPMGRHLIKVCHGTACHVAGARAITDEIRRTLHIGPDADTGPDGLFTIQEVACLGCCTLAPVVQIDEVTYGHLAPDTVADVLAASLEAQQNGAARHGRRSTGRAGREPAAPLGEIRIGLGSCCVAAGSGKVHQALERAVAATGARATIKRVGCVGMCHQTPLVETVLPGQPPALYAGVGPEDAGAIVRRHFRASGLGRRAASAASALLESLLPDGRGGPVALRSIEVRDPPVAAFLGRQKHIATEHCGRIDPTDLNEYLRHDGFKGLERCVKELTPEEVIQEVSRSGLRGRGGAGYPTGAKWAKVRRADSEDKYVVCNGDEGDPGAFMDRMLMESFPYRIIEGLAIAAYAVGADRGYFYIRAEYPLAVERLGDALDACRRRGFLGRNILGTGLNLELKIVQGAGAFVCGEETALLASIEGKRGSPRLRPPYPADRGLWGQPTLVNNVETYTTIPWIMRHGAQALADLGTATSKGTKVFALAGRVNRGGLIEVPMGVTIRQIVSEIGGGIKNGRRFKAVQIGGPSGGCIPAERADTPGDYEALTDMGAIMGSGGLVVLDDTDCMVEMARYFLAFTQDQSCGQCTYCRIGTRRMLDILNRLCAGQGKADDLTTLQRLAQAVSNASLCGLGRTAPNPVLSTLRYFGDEYEAHLQGRCPAGKCRDLITYRVNDDCIGCTLCAQHCPVQAIRFTPYERHEIDAEKCTRCDACRARCPEDAIEVE